MTQILFAPHQPHYTPLVWEWLCTVHSWPIKQFVSTFFDDIEKGPLSSSDSQIMRASFSHRTHNDYICLIRRSRTRIQFSSRYTNCLCTHTHTQNISNFVNLEYKLRQFPENVIKILSDTHARNEPHIIFIRMYGRNNFPIGHVYACNNKQTT